MKLFLSLLVLLVAAVYAQSAPLVPDQGKRVDSFIRENNARQADNPEGLSFTVRLKDNRKQFHHGEVITLELSFATSKPKTFRFDAATYERSGRLGLDRFIVDRRTDVVDPLYDYFNSEFMLFLIGGLRGFPDLTHKPYVITADVNEWLRFDKPGRYRLYVMSHRINSDAGHHPVTSSVVELEILPPDNKWARQKLNDSIAALSKPAADRRAACRALRFLGTTAAATEMRQRFRGEDSSCDSEYKFGLIGSPHRNFVIRDMESALSSPEQPVRSSYITTLALLEFTRQTVPPRPDGPYPFWGSEEQKNQWWNQSGQRRSVYDQLSANYARQVVMAIGQKQGKTRAVSLQTVLEYRPELNKSGFLQWSTLVAAIPEVFRRLSIDDQTRMLKDQWETIASPAMLPVLRAVLKDLETRPINNSTVEGEYFSVIDRLDLHSITLRRLYELSPQEGRQLILEEITRPSTRVYEHVLSMLPDETLPELNRPLLANLEEARKAGSVRSEAMINLIERYATADILPEMRTVFEAPDTARLNCSGQAALLAYFLRVDPPTGADYLNKVLAKSRCSNKILGDVAHLHMSAEVEDAAIDSLDAANLQLVAHAAEVLGEYGGAGSEKALWRRLERWHAEMQSRVKAVSEQENLERALTNALSNGRAWRSDREKLKRLRDLCLTRSVCDELDQKINEKPRQ